MSNVAATSLSYDEQLFLATYQNALGNEYKFDDKRRDNDHISQDHIQGQKIGYFLNTIQLLPGYCFNWNRRGPFSAKFQELLVDLDSKEDLVCQFYINDTQEVLHQLLPDCLFARLDALSKSVLSFVNQEQQTDDRTGLTDNLELLGSLLYIATTVLPGQDYDSVHRELKARKESFNDRAKNKRAWNCLQRVNFVSA